VNEAMRLRIEHTTTFTYSETISEAYTEMRLCPQDTNAQNCRLFQLTTEPRGEVMQYSDRFGNVVHHFDALETHERLVVRGISEVITSSRFTDDQKDLTPLDEFDYLAATNYAPLGEEVCDFASPHVADATTDTAHRLMEAVFRSMKYERGATDVHTTAIEALSLGRGVCQDFAHLMLAACRCVKIPARYVSGYIHDPTSTANETNAASHAWVDVFTPDRGWISLDPTHECEQTDRYVRVAVGRDYADVPPTRGVYKGKAKESLSVDVVVSES
jgi:transglutaminase-like putative cysteine protease